MRGHTGGVISMGRGFPIVSLTKQNLNTQSSTETGVVGVDYCIPAMLWTRYLLYSQGCVVFENIFFQYNKIAIIFEKNVKAFSSKHKKHIKI